MDTEDTEDTDSPRGFWATLHHHTIRHVVHAKRIVHAHLREFHKDATRSPLWKTARKHFLATHPTCAACGGTKRLQVHHRQPFREHPELELDPKNLITLCMGSDECHLQIGHGDDFKAFNPYVVEDAAASLAHPAQRIALAAKAKAARLYE